MRSVARLWRSRVSSPGGVAIGGDARVPERSRDPARRLIHPWAPAAPARLRPAPARGWGGRRAGSPQRAIPPAPRCQFDVQRDQATLTRLESFEHPVELTDTPGETFQVAYDQAARLPASMRSSAYRRPGRCARSGPRARGPARRRSALARGPGALLDRLALSVDLRAVKGQVRGHARVAERRDPGFRARVATVRGARCSASRAGLGLCRHFVAPPRLVGPTSGRPQAPRASANPITVVIATLAGELERPAS
jgi:hypothetical protein